MIFLNLIVSILLPLWLLCPVFSFYHPADSSTIFVKLAYFNGICYLSKSDCQTHWPIAMSLCRLIQSIKSTAHFFSNTSLINCPLSLTSPRTVSIYSRSYIVRSNHSPNLDEAFWWSIGFQYAANFWQQMLYLTQIPRWYDLVGFTVQESLVFAFAWLLSDLAVLIYLIALSVTTNGLKVFAMELKEIRQDDE